MKRRLVIVAEARIEIAEAVRQYEEKVPGLGRRFWDETKRCLVDTQEKSCCGGVRSARSSGEP